METPLMISKCVGMFSFTTSPRFLQSSSWSYHNMIAMRMLWEYGGNMVRMGILFWYDGNIMSPHSVSTAMKITSFSAQEPFLPWLAAFKVWWDTDMICTCSNWASGMLGHGQAPIGICTAGLIASSIAPSSVPQIITIPRLISLWVRVNATYFGCNVISNVIIYIMIRYHLPKDWGCPLSVILGICFKEIGVKQIG